jgi:DNA replication and repair protein RecF
MRLETLELHNFRNHLHSTFEFGERTNLLVGDNGQGKTNVIEAISFLCLTKSFYAGNNGVVLNFEAPFFEVRGCVRLSDGHRDDVRILFDRAANDKVYTVNKKEIQPFSSILGRYPVVICSPEHAPITVGDPSERRRFLDFIISQANPQYVQQLIEYRRILKHRNKLLLDAKLLHKNVDDQLIPWSEQLIKFGAKLMSTRQEFVAEFLPFVQEGYRMLVEGAEQPYLEYVPGIRSDRGRGEEHFAISLRTLADECGDEERRAGSTLFGPHRDELVLTLDGRDLRKFSSQGQHKTYLLALKIAEFYYLERRHGEPPIFLLDDIFSELDEHRSTSLLKFVSELSQTFITSTTLDHLKGLTGNDVRSRRFVVHGGRVLSSVDHPTVAVA